MPSISFLDLQKYSRTLKPVTSTEFFTRSGEYHEDGLFSEKIFGAEGSIDRRQIFSYIEINTQVIHPTALRHLIRLDRKVDKFISTEESFSLDENGRLEINEKGVTGIKSFIDIFPKINFKGETEARDKLIKLIKHEYKRGTLFIDKIPIIPPDNRPAYQDENGMWIYDSLNDIYLSIMRRAAQIKSAGKSGPLYDLLIYGLQNAVIDHDKYIRSKVEKKHGLVREQMMGKRLDFSGRAAITPGSDLKVNEIGIPFMMAVSLFEPFLVHHLLYSGLIDKEELGNEIRKYINQDLSVDSVHKIIKAIKADDEIPENLYKIMWNATEAVMEGRVVIAKRDPVIQREGLRAQIPRLVSGHTVKICTLQVGGFNADFDGDTMGIFHPLTDEAQEEARSRMMSGMKGNTHGITYEFGKEMGVGLFILTKPKSKPGKPIKVTDEDFHTTTDPTLPVKYRGQLTTMGKAIINSCLPIDYPFINEQITKGDANDIIIDLINKYGDKIAADSVSKMKDYAFKFATITAPSFLLDNIELPPAMYELKKKLDGATMEETVDILSQMKVMLIKHLHGTGFGDLVESGSSKGWDQPMQILVAKGIVADPQGKLIEPIKGSFADGLNTNEFFVAASGSRKGLIDRALNTADTGYIARKLAFIMNTAELDISLRDCRTKRTMSLKLTKDYMKRLEGRWVVYEGKLMQFNKKDFPEGTTIELRTPVFCESRNICHTCYGRLLERHKSPYIGVLAAQIIGERGTQMIMRCSDGLVHYDGKLIPFVDLWNMFENVEIDENGVESITLPDNVFVRGKNGNVRANGIQRHKPTSKVLFISTKSGHTIICQDNHPLWIKKNPIHSKYDNNLKETYATDIEQGDMIWIDNSESMNDQSSSVPETNGYFSGMYCSKESKVSKQIDKIVFGDRIWEKRLDPNFINYDKKWLEDFVSGMIDKDGEVFNDDLGTNARIYITSYYLTQQLKSICTKLGFEMNIYLESKEDENRSKNSRPEFICDIRFTENPSLKSSKMINLKKFIPSKIYTKKIISGFDPITTIKEIDNWEYPLYDIKTETSEYLLNGVQNHNTFHTGGAVAVTKRDAIKDITDNDPNINMKQLSQYLELVDSKLVCKQDCKVSISLADYTVDGNMLIKEEEKIIWVKSLVSRIEFDDIMFDIILDYSVELNIHEMEKIGKDYIELKYTAGSEILDVPLEAPQLKELVRYTERLLGGKEVFKDTEHIFRKLFQVYGPLSGEMDLVHLEVLLSQCLRDRKDTTIPARLGKTWDPILMNVKNIVFSSGFAQGVAFEQLTKAIDTGLVQDISSEPSILERVLTGTLVPPEEGR